jgi:hypothetical protein
MRKKIIVCHEIKLGMVMLKEARGGADAIAGGILRLDTGRES